MTKPTGLDIRQRIGKARGSFANMDDVLLETGIHEKSCDYYDFFLFPVGSTERKRNADTVSI